MNKKNLLLILVLLLLLFLGYFFFSKKTQTKLPIETAEMIKQDSSAFKGSFLDLMKTGKAQKCIYTLAQEGMSFKGTTYISGKMMRTDSKATTTTATGGSIETYMISDGEWMYSWNSQTTQGIKMNLKDAEEKAKEVSDTTKSDRAYDEEQNQSYTDLQKDYDYDCSSWPTDKAMFELPKDINFVDLSALMPKAPNVPTTGGSTGTPSMCAACEYAQDADAKAECKKTLGC